MYYPLVSRMTSYYNLFNWSVSIIGEYLVKPVRGDPRNPHATFMCELCDCFFCDEMARTIHCKGRRHRLNFKVSHALLLNHTPLDIYSLTESISA